MTLNGKELPMNTKSSVLMTIRDLQGKTLTMSYKNNIIECSYLADVFMALHTGKKLESSLLRARFARMSKDIAKDPNFF